MSGRPQRKRVVPWAALCLASLVAYGLSVGPVIAALAFPAGREKVSMDTLRGIYWPVLWLTRRIEWFADVVDLYINWWIRLLWG